MARVRFLPDELDVEALADETLLNASTRAGIPHAHACGGNARCSTCRVLVVDGIEHCGPRNNQEKEFAERLRFSPEIRLACQTQVTGNVRLRRLALDALDIEVICQLSEGESPSAIGDEKQLAILFADIRNFTSIAEILPPYDVV